MNEGDVWVSKDLIGLRSQPCLETTERFRPGLLDEALQRRAMGGRLLAGWFAK